MENNRKAKLMLLLFNLLSYLTVKYRTFCCWLSYYLLIMAMGHSRYPSLIFNYLTSFALIVLIMGNNFISLKKNLKYKLKSIYKIILSFCLHRRQCLIFLKMGHNDKIAKEKKHFNTSLN